MAAEMATSIATTVFDHSLGAIVRQFGYLWNHKKNMAALKAQVKKFDDVREDNNHSVLVAKRNADRIKSRVESWQNNAEEISAEAIKVIEEYEDNTKAKCLIGLCPNVVSRYQLSRKACKKQIEIVEALKEAEQIGSVSERAVRRAISIPSTEGYVAFDSRMSTLEKIVNALQDVTKNMVGVYGFGGMGKTTLVKQVASRVAEKGIFDEIIMALVTQTPDFKEIQGQIAKKIDLKLEESSVAERAGCIYGRLKEKKVLVILDDLWDVLDLEKVGIPFGAEHMGCKILLTSRYQGILSSMGSESIFHLGALEEKEAWSLFEEKTGDVIKDLAFLNIGKEVAKRCAGLPVLIVTVGASLSSRPNLLAWKEVLNQLKKMKNKEMHEFVNSAMEFISYKHLGEPHKRLFLLCGLLGNGASIANLLKYSLGWRLFDEAGRVEDARSKLHVLILDLKASCLLLDGDDEDIIKIHDGVRGVSISIARKDLNMHLVGDNDTELKRWPQDDVLERCTALVFHASSILPCLPECLECPSLEFLHISSNVSLTVPDPFFESTRLLEVLDMSGMSFQTLPPSISFLGNLQTLCLDSCNRLKDISILGELKNLQVLSLAGSYNIEELPEKIGQLSELRLLDLSRCSALKVIPAGLLKGLSQLEELYMSGSFNGWEAKRYLRGSLTSNVSLAELKHLPNLCSLEIEVPNTQLLSKELDFENLERFTIIVGDEPVWKIVKEFDKRGISRKFSLQLDTTSIIHLQHNVKRLLKRAESLCLKKLKGIKSVIHELDNDGFPELKRLIIDEDDEIQFIVNVETKHHKAFPALESLYLCSLLKLKKICNGRLMEPSFCKLTIVKVRNCDRLEYLFTPASVVCLVGLRELSIRSCKMMKEIVMKEEGDTTTNAILFPQLSKLYLQDLPNLTTFYSGVEQIGSNENNDIVTQPLFNEKAKFPSLKSLKIDNLDNIKGIWHNQLNKEDPFCKLEDVDVRNCANLLKIFPSTMLNKIHRVKKVWILDCEALEEVFQVQQGLNLKEITNDVTTVSQLRDLYLVRLPKLRFVWKKDFHKSLSFENLCEVHVRKCEILKCVFPAYVAQCLHQLKELHIEECKGLETIVEDDNDENKEVVEVSPTFTFPKLTDLFLEKLPKVECFYPKKHTMEWPLLKTLDVDDCGKVSSLDLLNFAEHQGHNQFEMLLEGWTIKSKEMKTIMRQDGHFSSEAFRNLRWLTITEIHGEESAAFPSRFLYGLHNLYKLEVNNCSFQEIFLYNGEVPPALPPHLKELRLIKLPELEFIWKEDSPLFPILEKLEFLEVRECPRLKNLAPPRSGIFNFLTDLIVRDCVMVEEIVAKEREITTATIVLPELSNLCLEDLPNLTRFCWESGIVFTSLKDLTLVRCQKLETFCYQSAVDVEMSKKVEENESSVKLHNAMQPLFNERANFPILERLIIDNLDNIKSLWHNQLYKEDSFCKLDEVSVKNCAKLLRIFSSTMLNKIQSLKELQVVDCSALEVIFEIQEGSNLKETTNDVTLVLQLSSLSLHNLPKLRCIWEKDLLEILSFQNLGLVRVDECHGLKHIFPFVVAQCLHQLEKLSIEDCKGVETIVDKEVVEEMELEDEVPTTFLFPNLTQLCLRKLPQLVCYYPRKYTMEWPELKELLVSDCDQVSSLDILNLLENQFEKVSFSRLEELTLSGISNLKEIWNHKLPDKSYCNLKSLVLQKCPHLVNVFCSNLLQLSVKLEKLHIHHCDSLEEVFVGPDELDISEDNNSLVPLLIHLSLVELPMLRCMWSNYLPGILSFKNLQILSVERCDSLKYLLTPSITKGLEQVQELTVKSCVMMTEIVREEEGETAMDIIIFPQLSYLCLTDLPKLTTFCSQDEEMDSNENIKTIMQPLFNKKANFPRLEILIISNLDNIKVIWHNEVQKELCCKRATVAIIECSNLLNTFLSDVFIKASTSSNHFELAMQTESSGKDIEEICDESNVSEKSSPFSQPRVSSSYFGVMSVYQHGESSVPTEQQSEKFAETTPLRSDPSSHTPANEPEEQTNAGPLDSQDDVASYSPLSPTSNPPVTEAGTSRSTSNSQQSDFQISRVTQELVTLLIEFQQIHQTQLVDGMSAEQVQFMLDDFRNLSKALKEKKKALEEKNETCV